MRLLHLPLKENSYSIHIAPNLLTDKVLIGSYCDGDKVLIVSNDIVAPIYLDTLKNSLGDKILHQVIIPDGEINKSRQSYFEILDYLIANNFRRNDTLIALGGGVIGDLSGFAAASFQRGMNLIQIPTTLLSQVDSSVGGKTAINHKLGKNLIGAFYQPKAVIIDVNTLDSLPDREFVSGMGEVAKYALLGEKGIDKLLTNELSKLINRDKELLIELIYLSCQMKADIVARDEKEKGERALLNLGHTFAHALETLTDYRFYLHGEAVSIGILMALTFSHKKGLIESEKIDSYRSIFKQLGLPVSITPEIEDKLFIDVMKKDKKNQNDFIRLVLVNKDGCFIKEESDVQLIKTVIKQYSLKGTN